MQIILEHLFNQTKTYPLEIKISPSLVAKGEGRGEDMCMESLNYLRTKYGMPQASASTGVESSNITCLGIAFIIA